MSLQLNCGVAGFQRPVYWPVDTTAIKIVINVRNRPSHYTSPMDGHCTEPQPFSLPGRLGAFSLGAPRLQSFGLAWRRISRAGAPDARAYRSATRRQYACAKGEVAVLANWENSSAVFSSRSTLLNGSIICAPLDWALSAPWRGRKEACFAFLTWVWPAGHWCQLTVGGPLPEYPIHRRPADFERFGDICRPHALRLQLPHP
jgi:hypothetical protein